MPADPTSLPSTSVPSTSLPSGDTRFDTLIINGRIIDPANDRDEVGAIGITDGRISYAGPVGDQAVDRARTVIDATGLVVAPGFIDMHSHAQTINGARLQALDGVTTALELEGGALPVSDFYRYSEETGRPINYGYSASWASARMQVLDDATVISPLADSDFRLGLSMFSKYQDGPRWRGPADAREEAMIIDRVRGQVADGAIGIGVLQGYVPDSEIAEQHHLAELAAEAGQPMFVHSRSMAAVGPGNALDAVRELIDSSEQSGAPIHQCHMNSTSGHLADRVAEELTAAQQRGVRLTTEAYPYHAGSTVIGAAFIDPDQLERQRMTPRSVIYLATGERVADEGRLRELRAADPGGLCVLETFDLEDPKQVSLLMAAVTYPGGAIASDAMPMTYVGPVDGRELGIRALTEDVWPIPPGMIAHPRSTGCFAQALSWVVRDLGAMSLTEMIRRSTVVPATILEQAAPALARKGRLGIGADADVTIFDPATVRPGGDYQHLGPSVGFRHVIVGGVSVVSDGELVPSAFPGRPIRGSAG
ncbi:D-glutamate deacylase [Microlunatus endophyticus]|uniref:D-glutamate deacylase n=1 Tax=Microlunatus endophyticus TaxID=1716077 RepID=A0A917S5I0_9ACTN|nr:amidohydrolase family protein [Microlunatus endophyticus]GGL57250.1 D-glutamate deacylase [Microlunatus endophyticus]